MEYNKNCEICGKEFIGRRSTARYCSAACRELGKKETHKIWCKTNKKKKTEAAGTPIWQINEEARKLGLTYGKYKALQRIEEMRENETN